MDDRYTRIKNFLKNYTRSIIEKGDLSKNSGLDATGIAIDLNIERANASRILNELWRNGEVIKIQGRPTLYLDFDIIKVRFTKGEVNTEIPVVMSPIDIVPDLEPPPIIIRASDFWKYSLLATVFLVLFFVVYRIINKYLVEAEETMAVTVDVKQKKKRKTKIKE